MATLITGAAGFIGTAVAKALLRQGEKVVLFDLPEPLRELGFQPVCDSRRGGEHYLNCFKGVRR